MTEQSDNSKSVDDFVIELLTHPLAGQLADPQRDFLHGAIVGLLSRYGVRPQDRLYEPGQSEGQLGVDAF